jgi:hypothetical protein
VLYAATDILSTVEKGRDLSGSQIVANSNPGKADGMASLIPVEAKVNFVQKQLAIITTH